MISSKFYFYSSSHVITLYRTIETLYKNQLVFNYETFFTFDRYVLTSVPTFWSEKLKTSFLAFINLFIKILETFEVNQQN